MLRPLDVPALKARTLCGLISVVLGEAPIVLHATPLSIYYFPLVWFGYILALDGFLEGANGESLWTASRRRFLLMIPISAGFWWLFEAFDLGLNSWSYVGGTFSTAGFVLYASVCFSTVLLAVWETAACINRGLSGPLASQAFFAPLRGRQSTQESGRVGLHSEPRVNFFMLGSVFLGAACIGLPLLFPVYAFPLIWGALFFLLDPANYWLGRPSIIDDMLHGRIKTPLIFAFAALVCGFLWEAWNYWSIIKWVYHVPYVSQLHLFEMPLPGYLGYLPFGLEVYAASVFTVPTLVQLGHWLKSRRSERCQRVMPSSESVQNTRTIS